MKTNNNQIIKNNSIEAVIVHMDGIITQTTLLHARAWKKTFDSFMQSAQYRRRLIKPLAIKEDYTRYFKGKPTQDGVRSFLDSRNIFLPEGNPEDSPQKETLHGLSNRKNNIFLELIDEEGVDVFQDSVDSIRRWRAEGLKTAVVSSSKNCAYILEKAGLSHLFDILVDGVKASQLQLSSKPAPDIFLLAAKELGVKPEHAIVIENAISGVQAGSSGMFHAVVGVDRYTNAETLLKNGANIVVTTLSELKIDNNREAALAKRYEENSYLLSALHVMKMMQEEPISNCVVFLDYETLAPIVPQPEESIMSDEMRRLVKELASFCRVFILSGRNRVDVEKMVGLPELFYAGSHGLDISGPGNICVELEEVNQYLLDLDKAQHELQQRIGGIEGARIERKKFAIAIHYSNVAEDSVLNLLEIVYRMANDSERLELGLGEKIIELHPAFDWNKEKAIAWLMKALKIDLPLALPIYIGEEISDQNAFRFLENSGTGVLITCHRKITKIPYHLEDSSQVQQLLYSLIHFFKS